MPRSTSPEVNPTVGQGSGRSSPATEALLVAPSDGADLPVYAKALRVFVPASLSQATLRVTYIDAPGDSDIVDLTFPPGLTVEPSAVRRIWASGTTPGLVIHAYTR